MISVGVVIGAVVNLWTSRYVASLLYGVRPRDPANLVGAVAVLIVAATLAAWAPLRAALRIDPAATIRCN